EPPRVELARDVHRDVHRFQAGRNVRTAHRNIERVRLAAARRATRAVDEAQVRTRDANLFFENLLAAVDDGAGVAVVGIGARVSTVRSILRVASGVARSAAGVTIAAVRIWLVRGGGVAWRSVRPVAVPRGEVCDRRAPQAGARRVQRGKLLA